MPSAQQPMDAFAVLPDPGQAGGLDDLVGRLRMLKVWAGDPSYEWITRRFNAAWAAAGRPAGELAGRTTVRDCFRTGRRRLNTDLVVAVVAALHPDEGYVAQWRQTLQVIGGQATAAGQVRVQDTLPPDLAGFTGRTAELDRLQQALHHGAVNGGVVVISAIAGMAGVGKTQLAIHAGHLLAREQPFDQVLFVNLRGFHPDPAQPPADPAAVLEGFLRLLGVPGQQIPHDLPARATAYRERLAGSRILIVLDNAVDAEQVRPLLPDIPGCPVLVTSRRSLTDLNTTTHLALDVFSPAEALAFLTQAAPGVPVGADPHAAARIAGRCGHLPLALGLIAAHMRAAPGWTLTDHADRLDERHHQQRLDNGVELALDLSYQQLPTDRQRVLRLVALHPGQDFDTHAAAALADTDMFTARTHLRHMCRDHLLRPAGPCRYTLHDLVRGYAARRASDEDPPAERRAALTRLFDFYLATAAAAMDTLHPAETQSRPRIPPAATPAPALTDPDITRTWLDTERQTLVAVAIHTATEGWPTHTTRLSATLYRYLDGGYYTDALTVHGHAHHAAQRTGDPTAQAHVLTNLGLAHRALGRCRPAADHLRQALDLSRQTGDRFGQARALTSLGNIEEQLGRYQRAADRYEQALTLYRQTGDRVGEARALGNLGMIDERLGHYRRAADNLEQALTLHRQAGDRSGEAWVLTTLSDVEMRLSRYGPAANHIELALTLCRHLGNRTGEAWVLNSLGTLHTRLDQPDQAAQHHQQALVIFRETSYRDGEVWTHNGLGEAAHTAGHLTHALIHHTDALTVASDIGDRYQHARADAGLGHAHHALGNTARARHHYQRALNMYTDLGTPEVDQMRARLATVAGGARRTAVTDERV